MPFSDVERFGSLSDVIEAAVEAKLRTLLTSLPVIVAKDSDGHRANVKSAIRALVRDDQQNTTSISMPEFDTSVVHFNGGGRVVATHPIKANDEAILIFASRALDSWAQAGGEQTPIDARHHDASDHFLVAGVKSDPNKIANVNSDAHHIRSLDGKQTRELHPDTGAHDKAVDPGDSASDPFNSATTYHEAKVHPSDGASWRAKDAQNDHKTLLQRLTGFLVNIVQGANTHTITAHPTAGIGMNSTVAISGSAPTVGFSAANGISLSLGQGGGADGVSGPDGSFSLPGMNTIRLVAQVFADLSAPAAGEGEIHYITDANVATPGSSVTAGLGTGRVMVFSNGTNWIVL